MGEPCSRETLDYKDSLNVKSHNSSVMRVGQSMENRGGGLFTSNRLGETYLEIKLINSSFATEHHPSSFSVNSSPLSEWF